MYKFITFWNGLFLLFFVIQISQVQSKEEITINNPYFQPMINHLKTLFAIDPKYPEIWEPLKNSAMDSIVTPESPDLFFDPKKNECINLSNLMIQAWDLPTPLEWGNAWQLFCAIYLCQKMKWGENKERIEKTLQFLNERKDKSTTIALLLKILLEQHGESLFTNTLYYIDLFYPNERDNIGNLIWCLSQAAEENLFPLFANHDIVVQNHPEPVLQLTFNDMLKKAEVGFLPEIRPKIIVDQTHSYNFETYHIAYFLKEYGFLGVHSDQSLSTELIRNLDVFVTHQDVVGVPYHHAEFEAIKQFVENGGGILLIGNLETFSRCRDLSELNVAENFPINHLANTFGFEFTTEKASSKMTIQYDLEIPGLLSQCFQIPYLSTVKILGNGRAVITDENNNPVLAMGAYRNGRVAVIGGTYFAKCLENLNLKRLFVALFNWLGAHSPNLHKFIDQNTSTIFPGITMHKGWDYEMELKPYLTKRYSSRSEFIWPEHLLQKNGVNILYAESMKQPVNHIINELYPVVYKALEELYQCEPLSESVNRIHFYPHWGSGYTWMPPGVDEPIIGIPCLGKDHDRIMSIFAHEMTHGWGIPGPPSWEHCWTSFTDPYFSEKLDLFNEQKRNENRDNNLKKLLDKDPQLDKIDISIVRNDSLEDEHLRWIKFANLFETLCNQYGTDLLAKYIRFFRKYGKIDKESLSMSDFIYYLSLAAGENLYPFFIQHGTTVDFQTVNYNLTE